MFAYARAPPCVVQALSLAGAAWRIHQKGTFLESELKCGKEWIHHYCCT